jgi:trk system potassium uptake protein TrkA
MAEIAVIGMGRFGRAVARSLALEGQAVLAIDREAGRLEAVAPEVDSVISIDTTQEEEVKGLRLDRMACVVVAIGSRATEASILTTAILRELGVGRIVARAFDERHARLLVTVGANEVLNPEDEIGRRLATRLAFPDIRDHIKLGEAVLAEVEAPEAFNGRRLDELDLGGTGNLSVLAIRRGVETLVSLGPEVEVAGGDLLIVLGRPEAIRQIAELL